MRTLSCLLLVSSLSAHDPGLSSALLRRTPDEVVAEVALANADAALLLPMLDRDGDGQLSVAEVPGDPAAQERLRVGWLFGGAAATSVAGLRLAENRDLEFTLRWSPVADGAAELAVPALAALSRSHRHYVADVDAAAHVQAEALLSPAGPAFALAAAAPPRGLGWSFFVLGIEHILIGYDHVCFLLALLLVGTGWRRAAATITAFTAAHSITLAAAGLELVRLPSTLVEAAIAGSIVWVAAENLLRRRPMARWIPAFGFGLVHGFGFASVLGELRVGQGDVLTPLLTFNLGVEAGQLLIAAVLIPGLGRLARRLPPGVVARAGSLAVGAVGLWWLLERLVG